MSDTAERRNHHLAARLAKTLDELPTAYAKLPFALIPHLAPTDTGSRQKHGTHGHSPLNVTAAELLDEREKPGEPAVREDPGLDRMSHKWKDGFGKWVVSPGTRRQGVLPTLSQWVRLADSEMWDQGIEHEPPAELITPCGPDCQYAKERP